MVTLISDEELASQLQSGREDALDQLVFRYHKPIYAYIFRLSGDHHTTNDLVQDIFIKLCRGINSYRQELPFRPWLYRIAANTYKDYKKAAYTRKVLPGYKDMVTQITNTATPEDAFIKDFEKARLIQAVNNLNDIYRETLLLRYYQELKLEEIAIVLSVPVGTVKSRLSSALSQLKQTLKDEDFVLRPNLQGS
ncbi:RNA polymerase sigma factor [Dendrosporobacter sp. 1207_IL3150]|uniref:RNA polymerase sigma factor n=1 Tax=Dendrosporobacter sp. 1207_IL3150 TaxID=3084054 RepID=UPI002FDB811E